MTEVVQYMVSTHCDFSIVLVGALTRCALLHSMCHLNVQRCLTRESSSSSYRAGSTDIPDPLSPLLPIIHRPR